MTILVITLSLTSDISQPGDTLLLIIPIVYISTVGFLRLINNRTRYSKLFLLLILFFFSFEYLIFHQHYFSGLSQSLFSPRRPIYKDLVSSVSSARKTDEKIIVNSRLGDPELFFKFYLKESRLKSYEFKVFNYEEGGGANKLFVDVLPDNATPNEPLFTESGNWPDNIHVVSEFYDKNLRQNVVVYRFQ
jgi:hypothetical protein